MTVNEITLEGDAGSSAGLAPTWSSSRRASRRDRCSSRSGSTSRSIAEDRYLFFSEPIRERLLEPLVVAAERALRREAARRRPCARQRPLGPRRRRDGRDAWRATIRRASQELLPRLEHVSFPLLVRGEYDMTPDHQPMLGSVADGLFVAAGFSGHGFMIAPRSGGSSPTPYEGKPRSRARHPRHRALRRRPPRARAATRLERVPAAPRKRPRDRIRYRDRRGRRVARVRDPAARQLRVRRLHGLRCARRVRVQWPARGSDDRRRRCSAMLATAALSRRARRRALAAAARAPRRLHEPLPRVDRARARPAPGAAARRTARSRRRTSRPVQGLRDRQRPPLGGAVDHHRRRPPFAIVAVGLFLALTTLGRTMRALADDRALAADRGHRRRARRSPTRGSSRGCSPGSPACSPALVRVVVRPELRLPTPAAGVRRRRARRHRQRLRRARRRPRARASRMELSTWPRFFGGVDPVYKPVVAFGRPRSSRCWCGRRGSSAGRGSHERARKRRLLGVRRRRRGHLHHPRARASAAIRLHRACSTSGRSRSWPSAPTRWRSSS